MNSSKGQLVQAFTVASSLTRRSGLGMSKPLFFFALAFVASIALAGSKGSITGAIFDERTGEKLVGVNVVVVGSSRGAATDLNGKYTIANLDPGVYSLRITYVGYTTKVITDATVRADESLKLDVSVMSEAIIGQEVTVTAERVISTEAAVLADRKKSATIGDGISSEQVKRAPDATSGDALKRVTGVSVVDNKFVFIRGVTDRYNQTTLDGSSVATTESGKKGFSFDLVPANLLDNMVVVKSATPDLPGDFSGGLVQINTLDFPDRRVAKITLASSSNSNTTAQPIYRSQGGDRDWLGTDDGARSFPGINSDLLTLARSLPNTWAPRQVKAPYNGSLSLALGDRIDFGEEGESSQLGYIAALSYRKAFQRTGKSLYDSYGQRFTSGNDDEFSVLWGALANASYKFSGLNKISFKNSFNRAAEDGVRSFQQNDSLNGVDNLINVTNWTERSVYTGQLSGDHNFPSLGELSLQWHASVSSSNRKDLDRKESVYARPLGALSQYSAYSSSRRSWSNLNDRTGTIASDFSLPVAGVKVKVGTHIEMRTYNYGINYFSVEPDGQYGIPDSLAKLPLEYIYSPENYGRNKFQFVENSKPTDSYEADSKLFAGYLMADAPFGIAGQRFRFTGGVRLENFEQNVIVPRTTDPDGLKDRNQLKNVDLLPSLNLTYIISDVANLRLAASHSVNRPEFREIAPMGFFDFVRYELVQGNPNVQRSYIRNYDIRFEFFPGVGEVLALSYFHKNITSAIEENLEQSSTRVRSWFNSDRAKNSGWEFEARKSLDFLGGYFSNFLIAMNYSRVESAVEYVIVTGGSANTEFVEATRPMQGQSDYTINASFLFTEPSFGTSVTIAYNKFGHRLEAVGFQGSDVYEEPRDLVDLSISQPIIPGLVGKFMIRNLAGKDLVLTRDGVPFEVSSTGTTYGLELAFSL
jgi:hypothetical protein